MTTLRYGAPESVGVDPQAVRAFVQGVADANHELHGFMIARHDVVAAQGWWAPYTSELPHLLYSLSKTFTATAWAFAEAEGLVERDRPLIEYWPELASVPGPRARTWTAEQLLRMASGHPIETFVGLAIDDPRSGPDEIDGVAWCFANEPEFEPGSIFAYNQLCTYLVAATIQEVTGQTLVDYLRPRLFDPLGISHATWQTDQWGRQLGFTGLFVHLEAALKLGLLYLHRGVWEGQRLLPEAWFDAGLNPLSDTSLPLPDGTLRNPDWAQGYGYQVWMARHGYRGDGAFGQFMLVLPELDAVIAINSGEQDMQAVLNQVWRHLLPGLAGESAAAGGEPLTLTDLGMAPLSGHGPTAFFEAPQETYVHNGVTLLTPARQLRVVREGEHWVLGLGVLDGNVVIPAGDGVWLASEMPGHEGPVELRASAGWENGRFQARVILVMTPHSIVLEGRPDGTLDARWTTPPLRGTTLLDLGLPG